MSRPSIKVILPFHFSDGIDNKFGLESIFYAMGYLIWIITIALFIDLFLTSITSPILYSSFAPVRKRRSIQDTEEYDDFLQILNLIDTFDSEPQEFLWNNKSSN